MTCHIIIIESFYTIHVISIRRYFFLWNFDFFVQSLMIECVSRSYYIIMIYVVNITYHKICILVQTRCIVMMRLLPHTERGIGLWDMSLAVILTFYNPSGRYRKRSKSRDWVIRGRWEMNLDQLRYTDTHLLVN